MRTRRKITQSSIARGQIGAAAIVAVLLGVALMPDVASAQVFCTASGTAPSLSFGSSVVTCGQTAANTQAAIMGTQTLAVQSNAVVMDRIQELRSQAQSAPNTVPLSYAKVRKGVDPITPQLKPAPAPVRPAVWVRAFGDFERRDQTTSFTVVPGNTLIAFDNFYRQRSGGVMGGGDLLMSNLTSANDGLIIGGFGGFLASSISVNGGRHDLSGGTVGVYSTYFNGGFFLDATAKVDFLDFTTNVIGLPASADVQNFSVLGNIGYKFDFANRWYLEPTVGVEYVSTDFSNQNILPTTFAFLQDSHLLRGRAGVRFGTEWMAGNIRIEPSLLALAYYYFEATGATISLGGAGGSIVLPTDEGKVRGELQASVNFFDLSSGWSGFIRGDVRFADDIFGGGGKVGVRYQW
jgi:outer membrane autotransporter protein